MKKVIGAGVVVLLVAWAFGMVFEYRRWKRSRANDNAV